MWDFFLFIAWKKFRGGKCGSNGKTDKTDKYVKKEPNRSVFWLESPQFVEKTKQGRTIECPDETRDDVRATYCQRIFMPCVQLENDLNRTVPCYHKEPFIYYVSKRTRWVGLKNDQFCWSYTDIVVGSELVLDYDDVI